MNAWEKAAEAAARGDRAGESYWLHVAKTVDQAPPLSPEQVAKLRILIWSGPEPQAAAA